MPAQAIERNAENVPESKPLSKRDQELREAVERVYRRYGTNLTEFYRDAHREAQRESEKRAR